MFVFDVTDTTRAATARRELHLLVSLPSVGSKGSIVRKNDDGFQVRERKIPIVVFAHKSDLAASNPRALSLDVSLVNLLKIPDSRPQQVRIVLGLNEIDNPWNLFPSGRDSPDNLREVWLYVPRSLVKFSSGNRAYSGSPVAADSSASDQFVAVNQCSRVSNGTNGPLDGFKKAWVLSYAL